MPTMSDLITITRTSEGLLGIKINSKDIALEDASFFELSNYYEIVTVPFTELSPNLKQPFHHLDHSWNHLEKVHHWNETTLFHILVVLLETAPICSNQNSDLPTLNFNTQVEPSKKTAANPRGYRGTKYKPTKPKGLEEINLQPYLCDRKNIQWILGQLKPYFEKALLLLKKEGYATEKLSTADISTQYFDPYFAYHHSFYGNPSHYRLPDNFLKYLQVSLKGLPWETLKGFLSQYWNLPLNKIPAMFVAICKLWHQCQSEYILSWGKVLESLPPERQTAFTTMLIEHKVYEVDLGNEKIKEICNIEKEIPEKYYYTRIKALFHSLKNKESLSYIHSGFKLANEFCSDYHFPYIGVAPYYSHDSVARLITYIKEDEECDYCLPMTIWRMIGIQNKLMLFIESFDWESYSPKACAAYWIFLLNSTDYTLSPNSISKKVNYLSGLHKNIIQGFSDIPVDRQVEFLNNLSEVVWYWDKESEWKTLVPRAIGLLRKLAKLPIHFSKRTLESIFHLIEYGREIPFNEVMQLPTSSFVTLNNACKSQNNSRLIEEGFGSLIYLLPKFTMLCFYHCPKNLIRVSKTLGAVKRPHRRKIIHLFKNQQLMKINLEAISGKQLFSILNSQVTPQLSNPVPKKLKQYFLGQLEISDARKTRYINIMKINLYATLLDILEQNVLSTLNNSLFGNTEDDLWQHTLQIINFQNSNRKTLKKYLRAHLKGEDNYLIDLPQTQKWLKKTLI